MAPEVMVRYRGKCAVTALLRRMEISESPHKSSTTNVCVCVCLKETERKLPVRCGGVGLAGDEREPAGKGVCVCRRVCV